MGIVSLLFNMSDLKSINFDSNIRWISSHGSFTNSDMIDYLNSCYSINSYNLKHIIINGPSIDLIFISKNYIENEDNNCLSKKIKIVKELNKLKENKRNYVDNDDWEKAKEISGEIKKLENELEQCPLEKDKKLKMIIRSFKCIVFVPIQPVYWVDCGYNEAIIPDCDDPINFYFELNAKGKISLEK